VFDSYGDSSTVGLRRNFETEDCQKAIADWFFSFRKIANIREALDVAQNRYLTRLFAALRSLGSAFDV
jgi:hypothetical protein